MRQQHPHRVDALYVAVVVVGLLALLCTTACGSVTPTHNDDDQFDGMYVLRMVDSTRHVVCYKYTAGGGISCLPLDSLNRSAAR